MAGKFPVKSLYTGPLTLSADTAKQNIFVVLGSAGFFLGVHVVDLSSGVDNGLALVLSRLGSLAASGHVAFVGDRGLGEVLIN